MLDADHRQTLDYRLEQTAERLQSRFPWITGERLLDLVYMRDLQIKKGLFKEPVEPDRLLRAVEVQGILGCSARWVWYLLKRGELPRVRLAANAVRVPLSALRDYIEAHSAETGAADSVDGVGHEADEPGCATVRCSNVHTDNVEAVGRAQEESDGDHE